MTLIRDQYAFSPHIFHTLKGRHLTRIFKIISLGIFFSCGTKFSRLAYKEIYDISKENNEKNSQEIPEDSVNNDNDDSKIEKGNIPASQKDPEPSENKTDVTQTATDKTKPTDQNEVEEKTEVTKEETVDKSSDVTPKEKK